MEINEKLARIQEKISNKSFLLNKKLSNEVGYYIFDYDASDELLVRNYIENLSNEINSKANFNLIVYDVYEIMINKIKEEDLLDDCIQMEKEEGLEYLISAINDLLEMDYDSNYFNNYIEENTPDNSVVFIVGVGKIFPFIRSHGILNKLHLVFDNAPVVLFYPGKYNGQELILFNKFKDDNYYRAFPLV